MKTYRVTATVTISVSTLVEAYSEREAKDIAYSRPLCSLPYCSEDDTEVWIHSGELDGTPDKLTVELE